jgi:hypothetical protein
MYAWDAIAQDRLAQLRREGEYARRVATARRRGATPRSRVRSLRVPTWRGAGVADRTSRPAVGGCR